MDLEKAKWLSNGVEVVVGLGFDAVLTGVRLVER